MCDALIFDAVRTPRGKGRVGGGLSGVAPVDLLKTLLDAVIERNELDGAAIDDLLLGCVTQVGEQGGNIAKVAALYSGLPSTVSGLTINRYCASGLDACNFAAMKVMTGTDDFVLAGGVESMSRVPMLSDAASFYNEPELVKAARFVPMGLAADLIASIDDISRAECDAYAVRSQERAIEAQQSGHFSKSLVPVADSQSGRVLDRDENVRAGVSLDKLATFEPLYTELGKGGYAAFFRSAVPALREMRYVHHAGNSPGIVDGASLLLIGSDTAGRERGLTPRARVKAMVNVCGDEILALTGGIDAANAALTRAGMRSRDVDLVEFNEAFAAVSVKFLRDTDWHEDSVNVNGGAIALGHAMGATGATLVGTVLDELERRDQAVGMVAVSGAAGIGTAMIIERV